VLFTVAVGYLLGSGPRVDGIGVVATVLGVFLVAASSAVGNQILERSFDRIMRRTRRRPLASGRIGVRAALLFGLVCAVSGTAILVLFAGALAAALALASLIGYLAAYTPLKRVTAANTLVGAVAGALPPMIGYAAAAGRLEAAAWILFSLQFVWQMPHFFAIAWFHRADYARAGFRMLSVVDPTGRRTMRQITFFSVLLVPLSLAPVAARVSGPAYAITAALLGAGFVLFAGRVATSRSFDAARSLFFVSLLYLPLLFGAMVLERFLLP